MNKNGQFLIIAICVIGLLLLTLLPLSKNIILSFKDVNMFMNKDKAFYLARAGFSKTEWRINNENWQGSCNELNLTDIQIKDLLSNTNEGIEEVLGEGGFRYIKIIGQDKIYVVGFCGNDFNTAKSKIFIKKINKKWKIF